ncbi:hypothetical protein Tco_1043433 [Tanacetum coccineum]|uniref:Uncharacterized protein n=1 Tax=Tanacetum coccineum TaxID=301880 RepID=A0ABQ5GM03_9ASTR
MCPTTSSSTLPLWFPDNKHKMISRMCHLGREHNKQEIQYEKQLLLLYQMTNTPYSINLNTPYGSAEDQYAVLSGKVDTSYPTGGYDVYVDLSEHDT